MVTVGDGNTAHARPETGRVSRAHSPFIPSVHPYSMRVGDRALRHRVSAVNVRHAGATRAPHRSFGRRTVGERRMTIEPKRIVSPRTLALAAVAALAVAAARPAPAQLTSAIDLSSGTARAAAGAWQNQIAVSPFARFDHSRFSVEGRWTAYDTDGARLNGFGSASATYFSPSLAGLQFSLSEF